MKWIGTGILSLLTLASWWAPYLMRRDLFFGVTVPPEFRDTAAARGIIRRYQMLALVVGAAVIGIQNFLWSRNEHLGLWWAITPLLFGLGSAIAFAQANSAIRAHALPASGVREVELLPGRGSRFEYPAMLFAGPAILTAGFALASSIPDQAGKVPLVTGWNAIVARWSAIEQLVAKPLSFALGICLGVFIPLVFFRFGTRRIPAGIANYRRPILRSLILFNATFAALTAWLMCMGALGRTVEKMEWRVVLTLVLAGLSAHVAYLFVLRRKENMALVSAGARVPGDRTPDAAWLWGMFYHNPDDPALFVEARTGPGYTMNFGHMRAWMIVAGCLIVLLLPMFL